MTNANGKPIVIDIGSETIKVGFAGDKAPQVVFPAIIGRASQQGIMAGMNADECYVGDEAQSKRSLLTIIYPIVHRFIKDWDDFEILLEHSFRSLNVDPADHPVFFIESPLNPKVNREKITQTLFEMFGVPALYISNMATLALYASGRTTGIVLVDDDDIIYAVPIYEGFTIPHAINRRHQQTGRDLTDCITEASDMIYDAIKKSDPDIIEEFYANIVLAGNNTMHPGIEERMQKEISSLAPATTKINIIAPPERQYSVWKGGAVLCSLSSFHSQWISQQDYDEHGATIVHKKCM